jgi:hypothetical protein
MDMSKTYLDPDNIESVQVNKKEKVVFITSKNKKHNWQPLADIKKDTLIYNSRLPELFIIDGIPVDTFNVLIEISTIETLNTLKGDTAGLIFCQGFKHIYLITTKNGVKRKRKRH